MISAKNCLPSTAVRCPINSGNGGRECLKAAEFRRLTGADRRAAQRLYSCGNAAT
jgi:hypothetical protein